MLFILIKMRYFFILKALFFNKKIIDFKFDLRLIFLRSKVDKISDIITGTPLVIKVIVSLYR